MTIQEDLTAQAPSVPAARQPMTDIQQRVLEYVVAFQREHQVTPTVQEVATHMGWASANAADCHLHALERKGYLKRMRGVSRGLRIVG